MPARHIYLLVPARHVPARHARHRACSARLATSARSALCLLGTTYKCPLGAVSYRCPLGTSRPPSSPGPTPDTCSLTGKKQGEGHGVEPHAHVMQKPCETVQAVPRVKKNKLFHMQKPCKTVQKTNMSKQKPCKMRRVRSANRRTSTPPGFLAICAICAISHKASH